MKLIRFMMKITIVVLMLSGVSLVAAQSVSTGIRWDATYYNNSYLGEPAALSRQESGVSFDWGTGSPASVIASDFFSAQYTTTFTFTDRFYRFQVAADDGIRITIDNAVTIIDTFAEPAPNRILIADADIAPGVHTVQVDYREVTGTAAIHVGWIPIDNPGETVVVPVANNEPAITTVTTNPIVPVTAWTGNYYANPNLNGTPTAIVSELTPSHDWGAGAPFQSMPADNFSVEWTGTVYLDGTYDLTVFADDGVRVAVDGVLYINEWHLATTNTYSARFTVAPGNHTIVVQYYEAGGSAFLEYDLTPVSTAGNNAVNIAQPPVIASNFTTQWLVQYYDNATLSGTPVLTQNEGRVSRTWGLGAPIPSMSPDNFSVRFIATQELSAGTYQLNVRADDGVRVYVDGTLYIDEWHFANGQQVYTASFNLLSGTHNIIIEYFENTGNAQIEYALDQIALVNTVATPILDETSELAATATVIASKLNVRAEPKIFAPMLTQINRGETYAIVGQNRAGTWIQLDVNGVVGWVNERYTDEFNYIGVAVTDDTRIDLPDFVSYTLTTTANVNMRRGPGLEFNVIRIIPENTVVAIEARTVDADWWQIRYGDNVGWVTEAFIRLAPNVPLEDVSIFS